MNELLLTYPSSFIFLGLLNDKDCCFLTLISCVYLINIIPLVFQTSNCSSLLSIFFYCFYLLTTPWLRNHQCLRRRRNLERNSLQSLLCIQWTLSGRHCIRWRINQNTRFILVLALLGCQTPLRWLLLTLLSSLLNLKVQRATSKKTRLQPLTIRRILLRRVQSR